MSDNELRETGADIRAAARQGMTGNTVGRAPGHMQANLVILPADLAPGFASYCAANPLACPLLAQSAPGNPYLPELGKNIDLRTDLPRYQLHYAGLVEEVTDITPVWREDFVAFALGCWLSAEEALAREGIRMRHRELGLQGGLFKTDRPSVCAGGLSGPIVVSMRPFARQDIPRVRAITSKLFLCHGAPLDETDPARLGIADIKKPDWGDLVLPEEGEEPLFWPCGLTAFAALERQTLPFFITHAPGAMLVTDLSETP